MISAHTVADVRAAEHSLMATVPDGALMQRAAAGLAVACLRLLPHATGSRIVLLVGGGDNGGDTLFAGARLAGRGARVRAVVLSPGSAHDAGLAALRASGGRVVDVGDAAAEIVSADLVIDGIVGIGGSPGLRPPADVLAELARSSRAFVVSVDLPSGVEVDSGRTPASHVRADVTVTFGTQKVCHVVDPAAAACGQVRLIDIGLAPLLPPPAVEALDESDVAALIPIPGRNADKYSRGVLGVQVGSEAYAGAAMLAASAAVSCGIGMVRVAGDATVVEDVRRARPEVVLAEGRVQAWLAGPGMDPDQAGRVVPALLEAGVPVVLDAGALGAVGAPVDGEVLLTPHAGELARMLGASRPEIEADRLTAVRRAAAEWGATVLLKGSTTLVATPTGRIRANTTGTPWLATAGSGDVLAGIAGALLAAGLSALDAASVAAYVHGVAGRRAGHEVGAPSASDVLAAVPHALLGLRLGQSAP